MLGCRHADSCVRDIGVRVLALTPKQGFARYPGTPVPHLTQFGKPTREEVLEARRVLGLAEDDKLHVLVGSRSARRNFSACHCHVMSSPGWLPDHSLVRVTRDVWVESPELLFLDASRSMGQIELIRLGMELCSRYCVDRDELLVSMNSEPPTSKSKLTEYLGTIDTSYGIDKARTAVGKLMDGSASPWETAVALMLSLPTRMGGFELPKPKLNKSHPLSAVGKRLVGVSSLRPDMLWEKEGVAIEYDSDVFHTSTESLRRDSARRKALEASGLNVLTLRSRDFGDFKTLFDNVCVLRQRLGMRNRRSNPKVQTRRLWLFLDLREAQDWEKAFSRSRD